MIIGIGGVSRSGKTSLAILIKNILEKKGESVIILSQDNYVFPDSKIPKKTLAFGILLPLTLSNVKPLTTVCWVFLHFWQPVKQMLINST